LQKLTLIRHGESVLDSQKKIQGNLDSSLTQKGISQFELLSKHVKNKNENFDAIFSSPLKRAFETASIISKHLELPVRVDDNKKTLVVSHAGTINAFVCHILNLDLNHMWKMHIDNTSITEVVFNNCSPRVVLFNDICHLNGKVFNLKN